MIDTASTVSQPGIAPAQQALPDAVRARQRSFDAFASLCQKARSHQLTIDQLGLLDAHATGLLADREGRWQADDLFDLLVDAIHAIRPDLAEADEAAVEDVVWWSPRYFGGGEINVVANAEHYQLVTSTLTM